MHVHAQHSYVIHVSNYYHRKSKIKEEKEKKIQEKTPSILMVNVNELVLRNHLKKNLKQKRQRQCTSIF